MQQALVIKIAAILGFLAVSIGAFGAHALEATLTENGRLDTFETAVKYHFYHALALLLVGLLMRDHDSKYLSYAAISFVMGIVIFSGSLYTLSLTNIRILGAITPIGGVGFILGWIFIFLGFWK
ncbi:DUF423 domain-containing protein [Penaeicola halotolerans]|uniref:DUF423 domain-containing protein n=1 Tax=Penaeicola halotolerans TaxID=2793196 RepID=UPI001CF81529|nr:DUF423 domain-containing protein [Penaeicola halotolerans]